ncbi:hypothetical protein [Actinomadura fibrosa]|uniref:DUF485 domain-containing protein n=1 Tax=Actinomadura fibrosa TaxID=111802 RepID=A0ABW2XMM8_9ACTN
MADERRVTVSSPPTARARARAASAGLPGESSEAAASDPGAAPGGERSGCEPVDTDPPDPARRPRPSASARAGRPPDRGMGGRDEDGPDLVQARALIRVQLRIALATAAAVLAVLAGLPPLLGLVPALGRARLYGVPPVWAALALGVQPLWVAISVRHLRRAERAERDVPRPADPS